MRNKTGFNKNGLASAQSQIYRQELQGEKGKRIFQMRTTTGCHCLDAV